MSVRNVWQETAVTDARNLCNGRLSKRLTIPAANPRDWPSLKVVGHSARAAEDGVMHQMNFDEGSE